MPAFGTSRAADAKGVVNTISYILNSLLPIPHEHTNLTLEPLQSLVQHAVQLAVEMRTQRAEYVMKRAPQPEYDENGVAKTIPFKASIMQNCGTESASDEMLELEGATVKLVLFPFVIRRGDEYGENYLSEATVIPMQVLVNRPLLRSESSTESVDSIRLVSGEDSEDHTYLSADHTLAQMY